jgi:ribosomal-protein-alanine N-acetyltransferase
VGRALLDAAIRTAESAGVESMYLEVRPSNAPALSLYATAGFVGVGRRRRYYDDPVEDALILRRDLKE